jgi:cytochrome oxidase assembly protein ShyY1
MTAGRLLLTRRWVGLTLLALLMVLAFAGLGKWQLGRSYRVSDGYSSEPVAVPLGSLVPLGSAVPSGAVGRQVTAAGRYVAAGQHLVSGHTLDGSAVLWVVTPFQLTDGSTVDVVRGWVSKSEAALDAPPLGDVRVTGRVQAGNLALSGTPGRAARSGYVLRTAQTPPDPLSLQPVPSRPPSTAGGAKEFHLQNAVYTSQWWIFAVLVVVYWWRLLRDERALPSAPE